MCNYVIKIFVVCSEALGIQQRTSPQTLLLTPVPTTRPNPEKTPLWVKTLKSPSFQNVRVYLEAETQQGSYSSLLS